MRWKRDQDFFYIFPLDFIWQAKYLESLSALRGLMTPWTHSFLFPLSLIISIKCTIDLIHMQLFCANSLHSFLFPLSHLIISIKCTMYLICACNSSVQANSQPLWSLQIPNPPSHSYVFQRNWMLRNMWETLEWKSVASRHSAQNGRVSTNCPRFLNREIQCLAFFNLFLDAIASPSTFHCQSVGEW